MLENIRYMDPVGYGIDVHLKGNFIWVLKLYLLQLQAISLYLEPSDVPFWNGVWIPV